MAVGVDERVALSGVDGRQENSKNVRGSVFVTVVAGKGG